MSYENAVSEHYTHGNLMGVIEAAITKLGKTTDNVTVDDLGPIDEFHTGGRIATANLLDQLNFSYPDHILDVGCGLGGTSRLIANQLNSRVTGIDLTEEYIRVGNTLCSWVGLDNQITLHQGSALSMPFGDESFDGALMLHVGMNIEDKEKLFTEIYRVLRPGACFGVYDVMQVNAGELSYPVPWATATATSSLASPDEYRRTLDKAGFKVTKENNRREFALEFFKQLKANIAANVNPPPLGLHVLMQESTVEKVNNMVENIATNFIAPIEMIAHKSR